MPKLALSLALVLITAACGSSTSEAGSADENVSATSEAPVTTASPVNVDEYCRIAGEAEAASDAFFASSDPTDPDKFEEFINQQLSDFEAAFTVSDPVIQDALSVAGEKLEAASKAAADNDYDFTATATALNALDSERFDQASDAVDAYEAEICGFEPDLASESDRDLPADQEESSSGVDDSTAGPLLITIEDAQMIKTLASSPEGLAMVVEGFTQSLPGLATEDAECFITTMTPEQMVAFSGFGALDPADVDLSDPAFSDIFDILETCDIPITDLLPAAG